MFGNIYNSRYKSTHGIPLGSKFKVYSFDKNETPGPGSYESYGDFNKYGESFKWSRRNSSKSSQDKQNNKKSDEENEKNEESKENDSKNDENKKSENRTIKENEEKENEESQN